MGYDIHIHRGEEWSDLPPAAEGAPDGGPVLFDFRGGRVVVANPDDATITRMVETARALSARVQGDEGEFYGES